MANLTKEYFDKHLNSAVKDIKSDIKDLKTSTDKKFKELSENIEDLAGMTARGFNEVILKLDVRERVEKLELEMKQIREAINIH
mgnify:CR=1 FL=1